MRRVAHCWLRLAVGHLDTLQVRMAQRATWEPRVVAEWLLGEVPPGYPPTQSWIRLPNHLGLEVWARRIMDGLLRPWSEPRAIQFWRSTLRALKPQVIHAHFGFTGCRLMRVRDACQAPLVVTCYGIDASQGLQDPRWHKEIRELCQVADRVVVLCDEAKQRLVRLGCAPDKIILWNCPLELEAIPYRPRQPSKEVKLLCAARFVEKKGLPLLIEATARVVKRDPRVHLTIVGHGPLEGKLNRLGRKLGIQSHVRLVISPEGDGFTPLYRRLLEEHDLFVLTSIQASDGDDEAGPALSMIMAQAAGLPVVTTPFPGHERSVIHGHTGLVTEADPQRVTQAVEELVQAPDQWSRFGEAGSHLVRTTFAWPGQVQAMERVYEELL